MDLKEKISQSSFLITGGAGFIGSNLVEFLLNSDARHVRVLDNLSNGYLANIENFINFPNFEFIEGDIRDLETCRQAVEGIEFISHQAALGSVPRSVKDPITSNDVNIGGHLNMLIVARDSPTLKKMVYAASSSSFGDSKVLPKIEGEEGKPLSPYAVTKLVNEIYSDVFSRTYGLHTVGLRYFNVFGPKQNPNNPYAAVIPLFMKCAIDDVSPIINGNGTNSRDFTFVQNAIQANIKAMLDTEHLEKHEVVNIAVGDRTTLIELWEVIQSVAGSGQKPTFGPPRAGDISHSLASISKAREIFGYNPEYRLKEGIEITYDWFKEFYKSY
jgi:UDP-N-acetylglucosamine 4-epimerase